LSGTSVNRVMLTESQSDGMSVTNCLC